MNTTSPPTALSRRRALLAGAAVPLVAALPFRPAAAALREVRLAAAPARASIVGKPHPDTDVWAYNGSVPGPELRFKQGERARIVFENGLPKASTVHWHGLRLPNAMDGVPGLTQAPVEPGGRFTYEFDLKDAGTFWYHPHLGSAEQLGRGLSGAFVVEEAEPPKVDRDLTWILSDWRLDAQARIEDDFLDLFDVSHAGRLGNSVTLNGRVPDRVAVRTGERLRLRLVNAANARIFSLDFGALRPQVIAYDGHAVVPHAPPGGRVALGPGMRVDLVLDIAGSPGARLPIVDRANPNRAFRVVDLAIGAKPLRQAPPKDAIALRPNPLPEPDLAGARRQEVALGGGMGGTSMGRSGQMPGQAAGMMQHGAHQDASGAPGDMAALVRQGMAWTVNGRSMFGHAHEPLLKLATGESCIVTFRNETMWPHPMHLHGFPFRVLAVNDKPSAHREWRDTVLLQPRQSTEVAFVASEPGQWMLHCHILEHQEGGMMATIAVA